MAKASVLQGHHRKFLAVVLKEPYILRRFYWTGGTVLAEFYFHHRESHDIDLFSEKELHFPSINKFVSQAGALIGAKAITHRQFLGLHTYTFKLPKSELKVDFNYYPFPRINVGKNWQGLAIDSLEDIAANKVHTISTKPRARDFIDLYFILQDQDWSVKRLIDLAKAKFDWHIDSVQLGQKFMEVVVYQDMPKMLAAFSRKKMEAFFLKLARDLGKEIFK